MAHDSKWNVLKTTETRATSPQGLYVHGGFAQWKLVEVVSLRKSRKKGKEKHVALPHRAYGEEVGAGIGLELWPPPKKGHLGAIETLKMKRYAHRGLPEEPLFPLISVGTICAVRHSLSARQESFTRTIGFLDLLPL